MIKLDGLDSACLGAIKIGETFRLVYSVNHILEHLVKDEGLSDEDAMDHYSYNIERTVEYLKEEAPFLLDDKYPEESLDDFADRVEE
jgi:hypothetical protein